MSSPAPPLPLLTVPPRQKHQKSAPIGIAAGAEDAKYHAKYKELKRKVKDIEAVISIFPSQTRHPCLIHLIHPGQ